MAYQTTDWVTGDPITQERMNKIENGIKAAHELEDKITTAQNTADAAGTQAETNKSRIDSLQSTLQSHLTTSQQSLQNGNDAMSQIISATTGHNDPTYLDLDSRFTQDENRIATAEGNIEILSGTLDAARVRTNGAGVVTRTFNNVTDRLNNTDITLDTHYGYISTLQSDYDAAKGGTAYPTLNARISADEQNYQRLYNEVDAARKTNGTLKDHFDDIDNAITAATQSTAQGTNYASMDARFEAIESEIVGARSGQASIDARLDNIESTSSGLSSDKIDKSSIANNLTTETEGKVLDARQGKALNDAKINYADVKDNLTSTDVDKPLSAKQGKELKGLIDAMDTAYKAADTALDGRVTTIEGDLNTATTGLKARMSTAENDIDALESALNTTDTGILDRIATAEGDIDDLEAELDTAETGIKARITALETTVDTSTTGLSDRMSAAESAISHAAEGNDPGGLTERLAVVEGDINTETTGIKARLDAIDNTSTGALKALDDRLDALDGGTALDTTGGTLGARVTALEGKDTIIITYDGQHSNYTEGIPNLNSPSENADYLIADDEGKYFYWRYFGAVTGWQLVGGAGGSGNGSSSGEFAASLAAIDAPDENIDYFVGNDNIGYTHYRYIPSEVENETGTFVRILPKGLLHGAAVTNTGGLEAYTLENDQINVFADFLAFKDVEATPVTENDVVVSTNLVFTDTNGQTHTVNVQGGGGGGSGSSYTMRLNNTLSSLKLTVPKKEGYTAYIKSKVVVKDSGVIDTEFDQSHTIDVTVQYRVSTSDPWTNYTTLNALNDTEFSVNVNPILTLGTKTYIRVTATTTIDEELKSSSLTYEVTQVEMSISAVNFNQATVRTTNFNFSYRCMGSGLTKILHFLIDGTDITGSPITTTLHNDIGQQSIPLTGLQPGMHSFQVYFTVDGIASNILNYYIIYNNDSTRQAPIIALAAESSTITYGDDLKINYTVATAGTETTDKVVLELYAIEDGAEVIYSSTILENVTDERVDTWRPVDYPESGTAYVRGTATHTIGGTDYTDTKTIQLTINELQTDYTLEPAGAANIVYSYTAYGRTNNDAGKEVFHHTYTAITGEDIEWTGNFNGFNWSGDGYVDGTTLTISGGATHTVNVPIFQNKYNEILLEDSQGVNDISEHGRTVEIEYEVASATDLNDVIIDYMSNVTTTTVNGVVKKGGVGFQVTPQSCYLLKSGSTVDMDSTGFILNESDIAAAYLTPGMRIHLAFVIEPWSDVLAYDRSYHQSVNIYVNGEFANACPYVQGTDSFASSATLRIGSSSCIIKLYQIKMYNRGLTHKEILQNYKMAPAATRDKLIRFEDNDILNADGYVDYEKARTKYTCLLLTGPEPIYTTTTSGETVLSNPTVSPYKGYPSPAHRTDKKTGEAVGKTESGLTLTKPNPNTPIGYDIEFDLRDTIPTDQNIAVPAYLGDRGAYVSSNNVQGTSSQKYPVHNLKVYLAKWQGPKTTTKEVALEEGEDTTGLEIVEHDGVQYKVVTETSPAEIKKVKYSLKGKDEHGEDIGTAESTLCWKADYMSTDHANTYNANIADGLFTDVLPGASWGPKHQNVVYGIRCLLFQKQGTKPYEFLGDGCLNNDKGNSKTYDLERDGDEDADTASQKWEFTNNSDDLGYFKTDTVFRTIGEGANAHIQAKDAFESTYPDEGDLSDAGKEPNYNHLQVLLTWLSKRANYWDETDPTTRAAKKQIFIDEFEDHINMNHALTYYLFSEYIALCDNRVKNMFLRSDNVKSEVVYKLSDHTAIFEGNSNPNADFFKQIDAVDTGTTQQIAIEDPETHEVSYETQTVYRYELHNRDDIDWENSTFAVWAPVLYDLDSCFGVENVGYIRVRYDANWDYTWNNAPQFNGYESRLWLQFADCFDSEIKAAALALYDRADGLNYTNFYRQQITGNLENISPALSNQDMLVKFDKPWSEGFINYSLAEPAMETPYYKYLQRGSRTAQKTAFMSMRSKLLSSKYGAKEFTNDSIKFRTGVPVGQTNLQDTKITVVANQVMYPGVAYGDNKDPTRATANGGKVNAGQSCDIVAGSPVQGNDGIFICGASLLTDIGDLSAFRPYQIDVGAGVNLKRLIVGSNAAGYTNGNTDNFQNLNKCVLLEEVNVRNCTNVSTLDLSNNALIKKVYAAGSGATTIIFPNGGVLDTIEYSAVTGNITILNQKNLAHFTYDGAQSNHYASLNKLWIENTPTVPIVDIINTAISNLTAGIRLVGIDIDLFDGASTQAEMDTALETTTQFLNTLVSDLAIGKYLDSAGAFTPGNTQRPYISGKVHVTSIRNSLLNKLNTMYPNLVVYNTIDGNGVASNNIITEYTVYYRNYDNTLLYTDYRTGYEHFIDPACDINPITNNPYISIPTKPEDEQYKYYFGSYDGNDDYIRYSGWVKQYTTNNPTADDYPSGETVFIADYPTTETQHYNVNWYEEPAGAAIYSYPNVPYGVDISGYTQPEEAGAVQRVKREGNLIKVFKGWDRPVGKLTGHMNVYAQWETSSIDNGIQASDIVMNELTAADLAAIAQLGSDAKIRILDDKLGNNPIMVQMGHDFNYTTGVNTIDLMNGNTKYVFNNSTADAKIFDGNHGTLPELRPLNINSDWTLALDFKFLLTPTLYATGAEYVLASCYSNVNSSIQGFKLSLVKNNDSQKPEQYIRLIWGNDNVLLDYLGISTDITTSSSSNLQKLYSRSYRNVVVLRHKASEPTKLYVYYTAPYTSTNAAAAVAPYPGSDLNPATTNKVLSWENQSTINTPLILGGNYTDPTAANPVIENNGNTHKPAKGVIYWGKFWDKDLGEKNCNALVSWPHEKIPFILSGYDNNTAPSTQIIANTNLTFMAAQSISDRYAWVRVGDLPNSGYIGWRESDARKLCNNRIYKGLSTEYQSVIMNTNINTVAYNMIDSSASNINVQDYFYVPAFCELLGKAATTNNNYKSELSSNWDGPWPWLDANNVTNWYVFQEGSTTTLQRSTPSNANSFLYRFIGNYIKPTTRIYRLVDSQGYDIDPYNNGGTWSYNNTQIAVQSGDIWVTNDGAYIYCTNAEINEGAAVDIATNGGGWKSANFWHTRTYYAPMYNTASENGFLKVKPDGSVMDQSASRTNREQPHILCPEFSI